MAKLDEIEKQVARKWQLELFQVKDVALLCRYVRAAEDIDLHWDSECGCNGCLELAQARKELGLE